MLILTHKKVVILIYFICSFLSVQAQVLRASIEKVGAYYRLTYTVNSQDLSSFVAPSLADFEVLSGPTTSSMSNYQIVNGHASHTESTTYTFILAAHKQGNYKIEPASVKVHGRTIYSNALTFKAVKGTIPTHANGNSRKSTPANQQFQQVGSPISSKDLFIDVTPNRTSIYEQEALLLTYRIHAKLGVGLSNTALANKPDFRNFISQEIPLPNNQIQTRIERRNNGSYKTGTLLQYVVFPQKSGNIAVPSITFNCTVVQQDNSLDLADAFFNGGGSIGVDVKRTVPALTINVIPLPQPKPANFTGAVGHFVIEDKLQTPTLRTNEPATYSITLRGNGNMKLITAPNVLFPNDFDHYEPQLKDNTQVTENGLAGTISFDYTFVPHNMGRYVIPSTEITYFDTQSRKYTTLHTRALTVNVLQGKKSNNDVEKQLQMLHGDIRPQQSIKYLHAKNFFRFDNEFALIPILLLILFFATSFATLLQIKKRKNNISGNRKKNAGKSCIKMIEQAHSNTNDAESQEFHSLTARAISTYIKDRFNVETINLKTDNIRMTLQGEGVPKDLADKLIGILDICEQAQYAPISTGAREQVYKESKQLIKTIETCLKQ